MNLYETERLLHEYLLFHYGAADEVLPWPQGPHDALNFPARTVSELVQVEAAPSPLVRCHPAPPPDDLTALDLGCAVGRSAFELAAHCASVLGIDYSQSFIQAATALRDNGRLPYRRHEEATRCTEAAAIVPPHLPRERTTFEQGDAMNLRADLGAFDIVHAANLLCRLSDPLRCLQRLPDLVKPGGQLLLTTPCTWLEEFTPRDAWPAAGDTFAWLQHHLTPHFVLEHRQDMPFLIREHARKYQWSVALATRWRRS